MFRLGKYAILVFTMCVCKKVILEAFVLVPHVSQGVCSRSGVKTKPEKLKYCICVRTLEKVRLYVSKVENC